MEVVRLMGAVVGKIHYVIEEDRRRKGKLMNGLQFIKLELAMVTAEIEDHEEKIGISQGTTTHQKSLLQLQELAYDIEDFIDGLFGWPDPGAWGPVLAAMPTDRRPELEARINHFKEIIKRLRDQQQSSTTSSQLVGDSAMSGISADASASCSAPEADLVGIAEPMGELLELLSAAEGQPKQRRVLSIVGCRGLGKTAVARALYARADVVEQFPYRAWVVASSGRDVGGILQEIVQQVCPRDEGETSSVAKKIKENLHEFLRNKRYLVIIDDVQRAEVWEDIKLALPKNDTGSRIIVTTCIRSVATGCSSGSYIYRMRGLGDVDSKELFWRNVYGCQTEPAPVLVDGSESIFSKCDGLPLALISVAKYLSQKGRNLTGDDCKEEAQRLGFHLAGNETERAYGEMKGALAQCYDSLSDHGHRTCLLSASIFPKGHQIKTKSLIRRWIAEGLIVGDVGHNEEKVAHDRLRKLIDRGILQPALISNNSKVKRSQVHGVMLEFIVHKSVSKNFVTLIHKDESFPRKQSPHPVRRLSAHDGTVQSGRVAREIGLSAVRSLTICNGELFRFHGCKLLRVLDLECCNGFDKGILSDICELLFLKHLNLRGTDVNQLPTGIKKLHCLETLDIRETQVRELSMRVIMLPQLTHLFGKFRLSRKFDDPTKLIRKFFSEQSRLETLAGVVIDREVGNFEMVLHARNLKKVKVWYKTNHPSDCTGLSNFVENTPVNKNVICRKLAVDSLLSSISGSKALKSISIDSSDLSEEFLGCLSAPCAISSIKLRGELGRLPTTRTLSELRSLNELHLFLTGLSSEALSSLQSLPCLVYLKLVEDRQEFGDGCFVVQSGGFPSLHRLCFDAPILPQVQIEQGAMRSLTSLELLRPEFSAAMEIDDGLGVVGISYLEHLDEVILYSFIGNEKFEAWKDEAMRHKNRPSVKKASIP